MKRVPDNLRELVVDLIQGYIGKLEAYEQLKGDNRCPKCRVPMEIPRALLGLPCGRSWCDVEPSSATSLMDYTLDEMEHYANKLAAWEGLYLKNRCQSCQIPVPNNNRHSCGYCGVFVYCDRPFCGSPRVRSLCKTCGLEFCQKDSWLCPEPTCDKWTCFRCDASKSCPCPFPCENRRKCKRHRTEITSYGIVSFCAACDVERKANKAHRCELCWRQYTIGLTYVLQKCFTCRTFYCKHNGGCACSKPKSQTEASF